MGEQLNISILQFNISLQKLTVWHAKTRLAEHTQSAVQLFLYRTNVCPGLVCSSLLECALTKQPMNQSDTHPSKLQLR